MSSPKVEVRAGGGRRRADFGDGYAIDAASDTAENKDSTQSWEAEDPEGDWEGSSFEGDIENDANASDKSHDVDEGRRKPGSNRAK
jgi:hypothetical protein